MPASGPVLPCPQCQYDVAACTEQVCPECGTALELVPTVGREPGRGVVGPVLGVLFALGGLAAWVLLPASGVWLERGSLLLIGGGLGGGMLVVHGLAGLGNALSCLLASRADRYRRVRAIRWWRDAAVLALVLGMVATVARTIEALRQIDDPAALGSAVGGGLFAQLYAALAAALMLAGSMVIARRGDDGSSGSTRTLGLAATAAACYAGAVLMVSRIVV